MSAKKATPSPATQAEWNAAPVWLKVHLAHVTGTDTPEERRAWTFLSDYIQMRREAKAVAGVKMKTPWTGKKAVKA